MRRARYTKFIYIHCLLWCGKFAHNAPHEIYDYYDYFIFAFSMGFFHVFPRYAAAASLFSVHSRNFCRVHCHQINFTLKRTRIYFLPLSVWCASFTQTLHVATSFSPTTITEEAEKKLYNNNEIIIPTKYNRKHSQYHHRVCECVS